MSIVIVHFWIPIICFTVYLEVIFQLNQILFIFKWVIQVGRMPFMIVDYKIIPSAW